MRIVLFSLAALLLSCSQSSDRESEDASAGRDTGVDARADIECERLLIPCLEMGCENGFVREDGCPTCECLPDPVCEDLRCSADCANGFERDDRECPTCTCDEAPVPGCDAVECSLSCVYGFQTDAAGCPACMCQEPTCLRLTDCPLTEQCRFFDEPAECCPADERCTTGAPPCAGICVPLRLADDPACMDEPGVCRTQLRFDCTTSRCDEPSCPPPCPCLCSEQPGE